MSWFCVLIGKPAQVQIPEGGLLQLINECMDCGVRPRMTETEVL